MNTSRISQTFFFLLFSVALTSDAGQSAALNLVLAGGRVMDPESGLDAIRYVGLRDGKIAAISARPLLGDEVVDVRGLVVAPHPAKLLDFFSLGARPAERH